jgi:hypothetical protein
VVLTSAPSAFGNREHGCQTRLPVLRCMLFNWIRLALLR